jgi:phosphate transport system substrate-binding protein
MGRARRAIVVVAFTLVSCSSQLLPAATPTSNTAVLRLYATTPVVPLVTELTTTYTQRYPTITFDVSSGNYGAVVERVAGDDNAYFISNHLPADSPLWAAPIGQDGVAVIVHPSNPIPGLTTGILREIYQGRVADWREVGGSGGNITVISREDGSGTRAEFEQLVMGARHTTAAAQIAPSSAAMVSSVARLPGSIGYVSMSYLGRNVRAVPIAGVPISLETVADNTYPLRSTLFVVGTREPEGDFRAFIGWLQSPEGQAVVARRAAPLAAS